MSDEDEMWIIPNNLTVSHSVRDTLESNWDLKELSQTLEQSVMWRSKPSLARTWLQRLNRVSWLKHLSGRILKPSMESRFVTEYTSSLAVIPASPSQSQDRGKAQTTPDTFGRILKESSRQLDLFGASSKTSQDILQSDSPQFTEAYEIWVTQLRQDCLQRQRSARHTRENGCLSWPTATQDGNHNRKGASKASGDGLSTAAKKWRTPSGSDGEGGIMENLPGKDGHYKLRDQVNWPTPREAASRDTQHDRGKCNLGEVVCGLLAPDSPSTNGKSQELWLTPRANETDEDPKKFSKRMGDRNPNCAGTLKAQVKAQGKLNPNWVEQLMGLKVGWTALDCWAME